MEISIDHRTEAINIHRMQLTIAKTLATPSRLSPQHLADCSAAAHELDARISKIDSHACYGLQDFQLKQKELWRVLNSVINTSLREKSESVTIEDIEKKRHDNDIEISHNTATIRMKGKYVKEKATGMMPFTAPPAGTDISSSADIQTLLLQQKVMSMTTGGCE